MPIHQPETSNHALTPPAVDWVTPFRQAQKDLLAATRAEIALAEKVLAESRKVRT